MVVNRDMIFDEIACWDWNENIVGRNTVTSPEEGTEETEEVVESDCAANGSVIGTLPALLRSIQAAIGGD